MRIGVVANLVPFRVLAIEESQSVVGGASNHEECRGSLFFLQDVENFRRELSIGSVVEAERDLFLRGAHLEDAVGSGQHLIIVFDNCIGRRIRAYRAAAFLWRVCKFPDVTVALEDQIVSRGHFFKLCAGGIIGPPDIPNRPDRGVLRPQSPKRCTLYANAFSGPQFVVSRDAIEHPDTMDVIVVVGVGKIRIERVRIELHLGFRFRGRDKRFLEAFDPRLFADLLARLLRPVISVVGNAHHQLLCRHQLQDRFDIPHKPILRGDGTRCRSAPVLVVVHQDNGVGRLADARVVIRPIGRREGNH